MQEQRAYLNISSDEKLINLLHQTFPYLKLIKTFGDDEVLYKKFENESGLYILITFVKRGGYNFEIELFEIPLNHKLSELDSIQFGEWLVDKLECEALVDCGGKYHHPLSDTFIRVSTTKIESVELSDEDFIDEQMTELIQLRK